MSNNTTKNWVQAKWRPMMGWTYMVTCIFDFMIFPILWSILQALQQGNVTSQWNPITLQGAGLYHLAMGAVLGVAAYSRGKEKLAGMDSTNRYSGYNEPQMNSEYESFMPVSDGMVVMSKNGKPAPVMIEPLI